jgi:predicted XRE-type DNA-binding protein
VSETIKITAGSGNVFADIDLPDPNEALLKAKLAHSISRLIEQMQLTQREAARILGVDQPKVSALVRGRLSGFSIERLLPFVRALQYDVEIHLKPMPACDEPARTGVTESAGRQVLQEALSSGR